MSLCAGLVPSRQRLGLDLVRDDVGIARPSGVALRLARRARLARRRLAAIVLAGSPAPVCALLSVVLGVGGGAAVLGAAALLISAGVERRRRARRLGLGLLVAGDDIFGAFPGAQEIEVAEILGEADRLVDDALLLLGIAQLDIAGEREILALRMAAKAVIGEDAAQVRIAVEERRRTCRTSRARASRRPDRRSVTVGTGCSSSVETRTRRRWFFVTESR